MAAVVAAVPLPRAESTCGALNWYRPAAPSSRRLTVTQRPRAPQGGLLCPRLPSASLLSSRAYHQRTSSRSQPLHGRHLSSLDIVPCPRALTTAPWSPQPGAALAHLSPTALSPSPAVGVRDPEARDWAGQLLRHRAPPHPHPRLLAPVWGTCPRPTAS